MPIFSTIFPRLSLDKSPENSLETSQKTGDFLLYFLANFRFFPKKITLFTLFADSAL